MSAMVRRSVMPAELLASQAIQDAQLSSALAGKGAALIGYMQRHAAAVARVVEARLSETISLGDFGAIGDGVANDTLAFQAAIAACRTRGARLEGVSGKNYRISETLVFGSKTQAFVQFSGKGCTITVDAASDIYALSMAGDAGGYCECGVFEDCRVINIRGTSMPAASGGIFADYSGQLKLKNVYIQTLGSCIGGVEKTSHQYIDCVLVGTNYRARFGIAGQQRNLNMIGGRIYSCDVAYMCAGDAQSLIGVDIEFCSIIFWVRALAMCQVIGCHMETSKVIATNADVLPTFAESAWADTAGGGTGINFLAFINCHIAITESQSNAFVIKTSAAFTFGLSFQGTTISHGNNKIADNFSSSRPAYAPSGMRLSIQGDQYPQYGVFPIDQYSALFKTGTQKTELSGLVVQEITQGKKTSGTLAANGAFDFSTGLGQYASAVFDFAFSCAQSGFIYAATYTCVQSYNVMTLVRTSAAGAGSADANFTVSWLPVSGVIRVANNISSALPIVGVVTLRTQLA